MGDELEEYAPEDFWDVWEFEWERELYRPEWEWGGC